MHASNGDEGDDEVGGVGGDEMRESGGEDIRSVPNCATALVYELHFLQSIVYFFIRRFYTHTEERGRGRERESALGCSWRYLADCG